MNVLSFSFVLKKDKLKVQILVLENQMINLLTQIMT